MLFASILYSGMLYDQLCHEKSDMIYVHSYQQSNKFNISDETHNSRVHLHTNRMINALRTPTLANFTSKKRTCCKYTGCHANMVVVLHRYSRSVFQYKLLIHMKLLFSKTNKAVCTLWLMPYVTPQSSL